MSESLLTKEPCDECSWRMDKIVSAAGDLPEDWYSAVREHVHVLHSWVSRLEAELKAAREELRNANRGAEKNMHMTQLALKEKHAAEAERDRLIKTIEDRGYAFQEAINKTLIERNRYREALEKIQDCHCLGCESYSDDKCILEIAEAALEEEKRK